MRFVLAFLLLVSPVFLGSALAKSPGFQMLRDSIQKREQRPKLYLPDKLRVNEYTELLLVAPGALKATLLGSNDFAGIDAPEYSDFRLQLGKDYKVLSTINFPAGRSQANFQIMLDDFNLVSKPYFLEVIVDYPSGERKRAAIFGANAAHLGGQNAVLVYGPADKKGSGANFDMVRSLLPGLTNPMMNY